MRSREDAYQHHMMLKKADNLHAIYDSLNYVSSCAWKVNKKVCVLES